MRCKACNRKLTYIKSSKFTESGVEELCTICRHEAYADYSIFYKEYEHHQLTEGVEELDL